MREIKFRGRILNTTEWVCGSLIVYPDKEHNILTQRNNHSPKMNDWRVDEKTVGQYTGLKDKNGKEIYEGDIIKTPCGFIGQVDFGKAEELCEHKEGRRKIIDKYTTYGWIFVRADGYKCAIDDEILLGEIIGNIYDNPELLEETK